MSPRSQHKSLHVPHRTALQPARAPSTMTMAARLCPPAEAPTWLAQKQGLLTGSLRALPAPCTANIR